MKLIRYELEVGFTTPAFLGNAEQAAEWRTPPFKALLRQMWRLATAHELTYDHAKLRDAEGQLFGRADNEGRHRSQVIVSLQPWKGGTLSEWPQQPWVHHPEVERNPQIGAHLYLGYGPLGPRGLNQGRSALAPSEKATLTLWIPNSAQQPVERALQLMHLLGTVGGRSRNGWGSVHLTSNGALRLLEPGTPKATQLLQSVARPWQECLQLDWPHALGQDQRGLLCWRTRETAPNWEQLMKLLAKLKIDLRTHFLFPQGRQGQSTPLERHVLAYPVTNHPVSSWPREFRMPNQLRFKALREDNGLRGFIFHIPWMPQNKELQSLAPKVWAEVHKELDQLCQRWPYRMS